MTENVERQSATIYRFPPRGRFAARRDQTTGGDMSAPRFAATSYGEAWYHDEAIREANEHTRKN